MLCKNWWIVSKFGGDEMLLVFTVISHHIFPLAAPRQIRWRKRSSVIIWKLCSHSNAPQLSSKRFKLEQFYFLEVVGEALIAQRYHRLLLFILYIQPFSVTLQLSFGSLWWLVLEQFRIILNIPHIFQPRRESKNVKWGEFFHIERKRDPCVTVCSYILCEILHTVRDFT